MTYGLCTIHLAFALVLSVYPGRACNECDGYIALEDCQSIGDQFWIYPKDGPPALVQVADCLDPADKPAHDAYWARYPIPWICDIDVALWGNYPYVPRPTRIAPRRPRYRHGLIP